MIKLMYITNYQKDRKTEFGDKVIVEGLLYKNRYKASLGREWKQLWLNIKYQDKIKLGYDLYVTYDGRGIIDVDVRECE